MAFSERSIEDVSVRKCSSKAFYSVRLHELHACVSAWSTGRRYQLRAGRRLKDDRPMLQLRDRPMERVVSDVQLPTVPPT